MEKTVKTSLETGYGNTIFYHRDYLQPFEEDLLSFLDDKSYMRDFKFAKNMMMPEEIQANNNIEGITDDLSVIGDVMKNKKSSERVKPQIVNLYKGYRYILTHRQIDKESVRKLYAIISKDLLNEHDRTYMGKYYRTKPVYILKGGRLDIAPYLGAPADKIDYYMNELFDYINSENPTLEIDNFIKSQVMHFYFVFIHPYFDMNGRTSRTLSMWYLLNQKTYPYIILNRAIAFDKQSYENKIIAARERGDITLFLKYMMIQVLKELEKEYVIGNIRQNAPYKISKEESQMIEYFISLNGNLTIKDLATMYNNYNSKRRILDITTDRIDPLIEKGVLINIGDTKKFITGTRHNSNLILNPEYIDVNPKTLKYLKLGKYTKKR